MSLCRQQMASPQLPGLAGLPVTLAQGPCCVCFFIVVAFRQWLCAKQQRSLLRVDLFFLGPALLLNPGWSTATSLRCGPPTEQREESACIRTPRLRERIRSSSIINGSESPAEGAVASSAGESRSMNGFSLRSKFPFWDRLPNIPPAWWNRCRKRLSGSDFHSFFCLPVNLCLEQLSLAHSVVITHSLVLRPLVTSASPCVCSSGVHCKLPCVLYCHSNKCGHTCFFFTFFFKKKKSILYEGWLF